MAAPNREEPEMEGSSASPGDKKRTKLGYQRTSVACVHCRRRKIRCLVAAVDAQGRCENCIRLKKECQFFPVDQQPSSDRKSRSGSLLESSSTNLSVASSPPSAAIQKPEQSEAFYSYPSMPSSATQNAASLNAGIFPGTPMTSFTPRQNMVPDNFITAVPPHELNPSIPWDYTTISSDPQILAGMAAKSAAGNLASNIWSADGATAQPLPSDPPLSVTASSLSGHTQSIAVDPAFHIQPGGGGWPMLPAHPMNFTPQPEIAALPDNIPQPISPVAKQDPQSPVQFKLLRSQVSAPHQSPGLSTGPFAYAGQPAEIGYSTWQEIAPIPGTDISQFPVPHPDGTSPTTFCGQMHGLGQSPPP